MKAVKAVITLQTRDTYILPGELITLTDEEANALIEHGFAEMADVTGTTNVIMDNDQPSTTVHNTEKHYTENHHNNNETTITLQEIVDAIELLDADKDYGVDGKPHVSALSHLLDTHISTLVRDAAWEQYQQNQQMQVSHE